MIEAFRIVHEEFPTAQLVLAGSMATDDPEGFHYWELTDEARAGDPDIHLLSNIQQVGAVQINAFQRAADVVVQKSLREGFGLTVSEGLWKGRPVDRRPLWRHHARRSSTASTGYLVDSRRRVPRSASATSCAIPPRADEMGASGREHVQRNFLSTRELEDWLRLFGDLG